MGKEIYNQFKQMKLLKLLICREALLFISLVLIIGYWILVSYPYFFSKINHYDSLGFLSLVEEKEVDIQRTFSLERKTDKFDNHLFKGEKVVAKIKATENNFGILLFRFAKLSGIVSDTVVFRIKKEGEGKWYYENKYTANQFQPDQYFTFGFPLIANSKDKTYVFEIKSLTGTYKNGIGVSLVEPQAALVYKYSQDDLKNYKVLSTFIFKKFVYALGNVNFLQNWQLLSALVLLFLFVLFMKNKKIFRDAGKFLSSSKFYSEKNFVYSLFLNTNTKKRIVIGLLIFLFALIYRFSYSLVNQDNFFYAGLGGQGDYDQFIRAATCAVREFCGYAILGQNFLFETTILGTFYEIFGFTGGLKAYLYLMLILSSIVATFPHFLLSRKTWISIGGIIGSLYVATSDFLTKVALNFPPDNGSTFTFSIFFIIYLLTIHYRTIRWLLLFGFWGTIDGLNKALFLLNNPVVLGLFAPVFFYEKVKEKLKVKSPTIRRRVQAILRRENIKILFLSMIPLLVFIILYSAWEYFVYIKFSVPYWLRGLILSRGESYVYYTTAYDNSFLVGGIIYKLFFLIISAIVMIKLLIEYSDLRIIYLFPLFLGLLFFSFIPRSGTKFTVKKFILVFILSVVLIGLLTLIKNNYFKIHEIFALDHINDWSNNVYFKIFLFCEIIILFILNFKFSALKLALPIIPYVIMLIILTKNSPFPRIYTQVVVWMVILLAYIIDWIFLTINQYSVKRMRILLLSFSLILFVYVYMFPKMVSMIIQLSSGFAAYQNQVRYLRWVEGELPENAIILAGGRSDLVTTAEEIKRSIIYSSLYTAAILIRPNQIPGIGPGDFSIVDELKNKDNFKKNKYIILEDDIHVWRGRVSGKIDSVFVISPKTLPPEDYSIKVYKYSPILKKAIYELNLRLRGS